MHTEKVVDNVTYATLLKNLLGFLFLFFLVSSDTDESAVDFSDPLSLEYTEV